MKAPKRKLTRMVDNLEGKKFYATCPYCGTNFDAVKRNPLPRKLRVAAELWISELSQVNGCEESVYILKELLRRAGGKA